MLYLDVKVQGDIRAIDLVAVIIRALEVLDYICGHSPVLLLGPYLVLLGIALVLFLNKGIPT